jgi:hypothetical protein
VSIVTDQTGRNDIFNPMRASGSARAIYLAAVLLTGAPGIRATLLAQLINPNSPALNRQGLWVSGGLGYGSASGPNTARMGAMTGGVSAGWTLSPKLQLGLGATGWAKTVPGDGGTNFNIGAGTVDARVRFYPDQAFRFFLTGGVGLGVIRFYDRGRSFYHTGRDF